MADRNYTKERDDRTIPVAREILRRVAERDDLAMGSQETLTTQEEAHQYYERVFQEDVIPVILEHKETVKLNDIPFIFSIIMQALNFVKDITEQSFQKNREIADAKLYGVDDIDELTVAQLDDVLVDNSNGASDE